MSEIINEIYIGDEDPHHWVLYDGKETIMGLLYFTIIDVMENNLDQKIAARIHCNFNNRQTLMDFVVNREIIEDTIEKVFEWAIENEEYEWCTELTSIKKGLQS